MNYTKAILELAYKARLLMGEEDPREPFVVLMTAAVLAGYIIEQDDEALHQTLDRVKGPAKSILDGIDEAKK